MRSMVPPAAVAIVACAAPPLARAEPTRRCHVVVIVSDDLEQLRALHDSRSGAMAAPLAWEGPEQPRKQRRQPAKSAVN